MAARNVTFDCPVSLSASVPAADTVTSRLLMSSARMTPVESRYSPSMVALSIASPPIVEGCRVMVAVACTRVRRNAARDPAQYRVDIDGRPDLAVQSRRAADGGGIEPSELAVRPHVRRVVREGGIERQSRNSSTEHRRLREAAVRGQGHRVRLRALAADGDVSGDRAPVPIRGQRLNPERPSNLLQIEAGDRRVGFVADPVAVERERGGAVTRDVGARDRGFEELRSPLIVAATAADVGAVPATW